MVAPVEIWSRGIFGRRFVLDDVGVRRGTSIMSWVEVNHYVYDWQDWRHPGDLVLVSKRDRLLRIKPIFDDWQAAAGRVLSELHPRLRSSPWFEPFTMEGDALLHPAAGRLPLTEIQNIELGAVGRSIVVFVYARGGAEWVAVEANQIADLWLWLELLAEHEVTLRSVLPLHLPSQLSALEQNFTRGENLPRATILRR